MLAALSGCGTGATGSSAAAREATTTTWINLGYLGHVVTEDTTTVTGANVPYSNALNAAFADLAKEEQKLTLDDGAIQADGFGGGCSPADTAGYASCKVSEEQLASNAEADAENSQARVDADFSEATSAARSYLSALDTFIGRMVALPWPSGLNTYLTTVVFTARSYRRDVVREAGISPNTPQSSLSAYATRSSADMGNFNRAVSALKAAFQKEGE